MKKIPKKVAEFLVKFYNLDMVVIAYWKDGKGQIVRGKK